jgi:hypothetical protein
VKQKINKEELNSLFFDLEVFISDSSNYPNINECILQAIQTNVSVFIQEIFEAVGYSEIEVAQIFTGRKNDDISGVVIYETFGEKNADKALEIIKTQWFKKFSNEILNKICSIDFYKD